MKKLFLCSCVLLWGSLLLAQLPEIPAIVGWQAGPQLSLGTEKVLDSTYYSRLNTSQAIRLDDRTIYVYDSLAREIRRLAYHYDVETDTLESLDQFNTEYLPNQQITTQATFVNGQWRSVDRVSETFREEEVLLATLIETWNDSLQAFVPSSQTQQFYTANATVADSILTQAWDLDQQAWINQTLIHQFYNGDELRDSFRLFRWEPTSNSWRFDSRQSSFYNSFGQLTELQFFQWNVAGDSLERTLLVLEYFNGDELKDSSHVFSTFGGFYSESFTIFTYDPTGNLATDTIYLWNETAQQLVLTNYQSYEHDDDGDLVRQKTFAYDLISGSFLQVIQNDYFYSLQEVNTALAEKVLVLPSCVFANPSKGQLQAYCDPGEYTGRLWLRLYDLQGRLRATQDWAPGSTLQFNPQADLGPGIYLLCIEGDKGLLERYKLAIVE